LTGVGTGALAHLSFGPLMFAPALLCLMVVAYSYSVAFVLSPVVLARSLSYSALGWCLVCLLYSLAVVLVLVLAGSCLTSFCSLFRRGIRRHWWWGWFVLVLASMLALAGVLLALARSLLCLMALVVLWCWSVRCSIRRWGDVGVFMVLVLGVRVADVVGPFVVVLDSVVHAVHPFIHSLVRRGIRRCWWWD
jgi:hypothetical protein